MAGVHQQTAVNLDDGFDDADYLGGFGGEPAGGEGALRLAEV